MFRGDADGRKCFTVVRIAVYCALMLVAAGCSQAGLTKVYEPVRGRWITDRGAIVEVAYAPDGTVHAIVRGTPGIMREDIRDGTVVVEMIEPAVDGGFNGWFILPGGLDPVKVRMVPRAGGTMAITSTDSRVFGTRMLWRREEDVPE